MTAFLCDFAAAATSFDIQVTAAAHGSPGSSGPAQQDQATGCRPGLWRVTYTNGYPAGGPGGGSTAGSVDVAGDLFRINPGTGTLEWVSQERAWAGFLDDGNMSSIRSPATLISGTTYESFFCAGNEITFTIEIPYTTYYNGLTLRAQGTWQKPCSGAAVPAFLSQA